MATNNPHQYERPLEWKEVPAYEMDQADLRTEEGRDLFNTFVAAIADMFGLSSLSTLDEFGYADTNFIRIELRRLRNELMTLYNRYPDRENFLTKNNMTLGDFEQLLKQALNEQSDFAKWALAYSPVSTAYQKFHDHASKLSRKVNEITTSNSQAESEYQDAVAQHASKQDKIGGLISNLEALDSDLAELRNTTAIEKTNPSFKALLDSEKDEAAKTAAQVHTFLGETS